MVRNLRPDDIPVLKEIHARRGYDFTFPELFVADKDTGELKPVPEFLDLEVRVDENDRPVMAVAARQTVEVYLWVDEQWRTPRWRMAALVEIHEAVRVRLKELGIKDVHAWPPPEVVRAFGRRLRRVFGWMPSRWQCWSRRTD